MTRYLRTIWWSHLGVTISELLFRGTACGHILIWEESQQYQNWISRNYQYNTYSKSRNAVLIIHIEVFKIVWGNQTKCCIHQQRLSFELIWIRLTSEWNFRTWLVCARFRISCKRKLFRIAHEFVHAEAVHDWALSVSITTLDLAHPKKKHFSVSKIYK